MEGMQLGKRADEEKFVGDFHEVEQEQRQLLRMGFVMLAKHDRENRISEHPRVEAARHSDNSGFSASKSLPAHVSQPVGQHSTWL